MLAYALRKLKKSFTQLLYNKGDGFMKTHGITKLMMMASIILLIGSTFAFAHGRWGGGNGPMDGDDCPGRRYKAGCGDLTAEEAAKTAEAREQFHSDTEELRLKIRQIRTEMRSEMTKDDPDDATVLDLQKQLSSVKAEFDQKRVKHHLEMRKLLPDKFKADAFGRGYGHGGGCRR
jgi:Spy/CpxP family protein refolding chaperone